MTQKDKQKCAGCVLISLIGACLFFYSLVLPTIDRETVRIIAGWFTIMLGCLGGAVCFCFAYWQSKNPTELSCLLRDVYFATGLLALATAVMGLGGAVTFTKDQWDIIYNIRVIPLLLEVVTISRLFIYMRKL